MYIQVKLLRGWNALLWYSVPHHLQTNLLKQGTVVQVPFRAKIIPAYVLTITPQKPLLSFAMKDIIEYELLPPDPLYLPLLKQIAQYYHIDHLFFIKRIQQFLHQKNEPISIDVEILHKQNIQQKTILTDEQKKIAHFIVQAVDTVRFTPIVLHGVTGSGKTEIYKQAIIHAINQEKTVILLLPEVTLATEFENRLSHELSEIVIFGFHSGKTVAEKQILWKSLLKNQACLIIGVHLPILLPIQNLGLIIVDEEHETGYQEKTHPKIHSKQIALWSAAHRNIPIVLGSATPSLATLHAVKTKKYYFFQLKKRFAGNFPHIQTVLLTDNKKKRFCFWITKELENAIADRLQKKEQTIIFLNRRGYSFFVQCKECSFIFCCTNCSVSLTLHDQSVLLCHYCGMQQQMPSCCLSCKTDAKHLLKKGVGTQQIITTLKTMFPHARIAQADKDVTTKKKMWKQTVSDFTQGNLDILVGTQTITKGYHFPRVTLVGIIWADLNLHFPFFNATETTLQQLIQVAGRAGRAHTASKVIIQTMSHHSLFSYINETDYLKFYADEILSRQKFLYPPVHHLISIELKHTDEMIVEKEAHCIAQELSFYGKEINMIVLGPTKPLVHKIKNAYQRVLYIKCFEHTHAIQSFKKINTQNFVSKIFFTPMF